MNKKIVALFVVLAFLAVIPVFAAQSRTTEYHKTGQKISADTTLNITLPDGYFVTGTIKGPTGAVVKGASVYIGDATDQYSGFSGVADASGKFSVPVQAGNKYLGVAPPASASVDPSKFSRLLSKIQLGVSITKDTAVGDITLQNGFILSGKVDPPAGSGTLMIFMPYIEIFPPTSLTPVGIAQVGGTSQLLLNKYAAALPAGSYRLLSRAVGSTMMGQYVPMLPKTDSVKISKDTVKNLVMLKGGYSLSGTVKDAAGKGLDGILFIIPKSGTFKGWDIQETVVLKGSFGVLTGLNSKTTFIPAGSYMLVFVPIGFEMNTYTGKATVTSFDLTMPAAAKTLALVAKNGFVVTGKITDAKSKAMSAIITAFNPTAPLNIDLLGLNFMVGATNTKGVYRFTLPAGTYNLFSVPGSATAAQKPEEMLRRMILRAAQAAKNQ